MSRRPKSEPPFNPEEHYLPDETCLNIECQANKYPDLLDEPKPMSCVGSETGDFQSIYDLIVSSFKCADRILLMTPWGNYVVFKVLKQPGDTKANDPITYFLHDGCTCNANSFRYLDLRTGTAGFLSFCSVRSMVYYILESQYKRERLLSISKPNLDAMCVEKRPTGEVKKEDVGEKKT